MNTLLKKQHTMGNNLCTYIYTKSFNNHQSTLSCARGRCGVPQGLWCTTNTHNMSLISLYETENKTFIVFDAHAILRVYHHKQQAGNIFTLFCVQSGFYLEKYFWGESLW